MKTKEKPSSANVYSGSAHVLAVGPNSLRRAETRLDLPSVTENGLVVAETVGEHELFPHPQTRVGDLEVTEGILLVDIHAGDVEDKRRTMLQENARKHLLF
ncbi:hypothetical protein TGRH88_072120 [Toxoplasma gondii]|uniref:Uncharacterized protein n=1 Tax=Toxoplasma gondii TaxID=5811 RepID=A0A7J6K404_TOXGO|nr:hypothetical protein TGRH88_072120 [Toxoplasma gondii]